MAGVVKNASVLSRRAVAEWSYVLARRCSTFAAPTPITYTDVQPPPEALRSVDSYRAYKATVHLRNRNDPEMEKKARKNELIVPLEAVKQEWMGPRGLGLRQLKTMGLHSHIYQDLYGATFHPQGFIDVFYSDIHHVTWGQIIQAKHAQAPPRVMVPGCLYPQSPWGDHVNQKHAKYPDVNYVTLTLTNPDGHLLDSSQEVLHWMVANVPVVAEDQESWRLPTDAHTVVPYLAPVPPSGTGVHRFVFTLYTHAHPLKKTPTWSKKASEDWIHQRTFSSAQFLADNMSVGGGMRPFTFSYFQTYWDASVRHIFKHVLKYPEPVYGLEKRISPRKLKQKVVREVRGAKYTML